MFVDIIDIRAKAGDGGNGCVSFHREKFVQQGGPDGGDGGKGGDIAFVASERMRTLMDFRFKRNFSAGNGADGSAGRCRGKAGEDIDIEVPVGTVVREKASGRVLLDMREAGVRRVLMRGGNGGFGNARFATPTRQAPQFAKPGEKRPMMELTLELKSIADVGLVGFPNVGKSTILSVVTSARPKIANYHFTTLQPNLGIVVQDEFSFVMADIPGLVEGASQGVGLGHAFLRHIERTRLLVHVIDISGSEMRDPLEDYDAILAELKAYGDLAARPMLIAANKCDLPGSEENLARLRAKLPDAEIFPVSAATHAGFAPLLRRAADLLRAMPAAEPFLEEEPMEIVEEEPFSIEMDGDVFVLSGPAIDRLFNSVNFEDELSLNYFHRTLRRWGVIDALRARGAKEGDSVRIEDMEFDFVE
ncbi:MAG TPA: GTPase ObgE [Candidatus Ornithocaccomicrobium faecavium]|uniref:GTPase Obg n=1 Tax=Candidatus Ornithocaccomicrobium faecavium TaxID=2840890 RepID=A0A9D1P816_9FIRM|nr:GTPase ObgE [Candidatus Ornithocaccomicrobium faecavium]